MAVTIVVLQPCCIMQFQFVLLLYFLFFFFFLSFVVVFLYIYTKHWRQVYQNKSIKVTSVFMSFATKFMLAWEMKSILLKFGNEKKKREIIYPRVVEIIHDDNFINLSILIYDSRTTQLVGCKRQTDASHSWIRLSKVRLTDSIPAVAGYRWKEVVMQVRPWNT